jgi:hypothetical protein
MPAHIARGNATGVRLRYLLLKYRKASIDRDVGRHHNATARRLTQARINRDS